jgi:hypothetical protein
LKTQVKDLEEDKNDGKLGHGRAGILGFTNVHASGGQFNGRNKYNGSSVDRSYKADDNVIQLWEERIGQIEKKLKET